MKPAMRAITKQLKLVVSTIRYMVHIDIRYNSEVTMRA